MWWLLSFASAALLGCYDSFKKISLKPDDVVMTEAIGIDIELEGKKYKVFDTDFIVSKVDLKGEQI